MDCRTGGSRLAATAMNWTILVSFALAVLMGAALASLLVTIRPQWTPRRRHLMAASALPLITVLATPGVLFIRNSRHGAGDTMEDLAIRAVLTLGGDFVLLAFLGGLVGATLAGIRRNR